MFYGAMVRNVLLWQYIASLRLLPYTRHLSDVTVCYEGERPICYAGSSVLVCKVERDGKPMALRVYRSCRNNLSEIYGERYYPFELPILGYTDRVAEYADVVLMDWYDGETLQRVLEQRVGDVEYMRRLSRKFEQYALWVLDQEWAHGDIKPDNIIVNGEEIHLIDLDSLYKPSFKSDDCEEIGSHGFQHPMRSRENFSKAIDDYPIALIITALAAFSYDASFAEQITSSGKFLISPLNAILGKEEWLDRIERLFVERGDARHYRIAQLLRSPHLALYRLRDYIAMEVGEVRDASRLEVDVEEGLWGYKEGDRWIIPPLYDSAFEAENGLCRVVLNGHILWLNAKGEVVEKEG